MSTLASQLKQLAFAQQGAEGVSSSKRLASLLYNESDARGMSMEDVCSLGSVGFTTLCSIYEPFQTFSPLFGAPSAEVKRHMQTKEQNDMLDTQLARFLRCLSPYMMLPASHKCFEWLLRRYEVHIHNVPSVMEAILPYHETNVFARIVQLLVLKNHQEWAFLVSVQKSRTGLSRLALVKRCAADDALLQFFCKMVKRAVNNKPVAPASLQGVIATYASIVTGVVSDGLSESVARIVLPYVIEGLKSTHEDVASANIMISTQLVTMVPLAAEATEALLNSYSHFTDDSKDIRMRMMAMAVLCATQTPASLPQACVDALLQLEDVGTKLVDLSTTYNVRTLASCFLASLLKDSTLDSDVLLSLVSSIEICCGKGFDDEVKQHLESRGSVELDTFTRQKMFGLRHTHINDFDINVFQGIMHFDPKVRAAAIHTVATSLKEADSVSSQDKEFLGKHLLACFNDEDEEVRKAALQEVAQVLIVINLDTIVKACLQNASSELKKNREYLSAYLFAVFEVILPTAEKERNVNALKMIDDIITDHILPMCVFKPQRFKIPKAVLTSLASATHVLNRHKYLVNIPTLISESAQWNKNMSASKANKVLFNFLGNHKNASVFEKLSFDVQAPPAANLVLASILLSSPLIKNEEKAREVVQVMEFYAKQCGIVSQDDVNAAFKKLQLQSGMSMECFLPPLALPLAQDVSLWGSRRRVALLHYTAGVLLHVSKIHPSKSKVIKDVLNAATTTSFPSAFVKVVAHITTNPNFAPSMFASVCLSEKATIATKTTCMYLLASIMKTCSGSVPDASLPLALVMSASPHTSIRAAALSFMATTIQNSNLTLSTVDSKFVIIFTALLESKNDIAVHSDNAKQVIASVVSGSTQSSSKKRSKATEEPKYLDLVNFLLSWAESLDASSDNEGVLVAMDAVVQALALCDGVTIAKAMVPFLSKFITSSRSLNRKGVDLVEGLLAFFNPYTMGIVVGDKSLAAMFSSILKHLLSPTASLKTPKELPLHKVASKHLLQPHVYAKFPFDLQLKTLELLGLLASSSGVSYDDVLKYQAPLLIPSKAFIHVLSYGFNSQSLSQNGALVTEEEEESSQERSAKKSKRGGARGSAKSAPTTARRDSFLNLSNSEVCAAFRSCLFPLDSLSGRSSSQLDADQHELVSSLMTLLSAFQRLEQAEKESVEEQVQCVIQALQNVLESAKIGSVKEEDVDADLLVKVLMEGNSVTQNKAFLLLASMAKLFPRQVVTSVMPVLSFVRTSKFNVHDDYSVSVLQRSVSAIIPAIKSSSETQQQSLDLLVEVCSIFVDSFYSFPQYRRLPLFSQILDILGQKEFLYILILLLLKKETVDSRGYEDNVSNQFVAESSHISRSKSKTSQIPQFVLSLCKSVPIDIHIHSLCMLMRALVVLPVTSNTPLKQSKSMDETWAVAKLLGKGAGRFQAKPMRHWRYLLVNQVIKHFASRTVLRQYALLSPSSPAYSNVRKSMISAAGLTLELDTVVKVQASQALVANNAEFQRLGKERFSAGTEAYWKSIAHGATKATMNVFALLNLNDFVDICMELLGSNVEGAQQDAIKMITSRIVSISKTVKHVTEEEVATVVPLLPLLSELATQSIVLVGKSPKQKQENSAGDNDGSEDSDGDSSSSSSDDDDESDSEASDNEGDSEAEEEEEEDENENEEGSEATKAATKKVVKKSGWYITNSAATHAMAVLAARYAQHAPTVFVQHAKTILSLVDSKEEAEMPLSLVATCMASLAVFCKALGQRLLPLFPRILPHITVSINMCVSNEAHKSYEKMESQEEHRHRRHCALLLTSALELSLVCVQQYSSMFSNSLASFLAACCHPRLCTNGIGVPEAVVSKAAIVREAIGNTLLPRFIAQSLPPCYKSVCMSAAETQDIDWEQRASSIGALFQVLQTSIAAHSQADLRGQVKPLFRFLATALQFRSLVWEGVGVGGLFISSDNKKKGDADDVMKSKDSDSADDEDDEDDEDEDLSASLHASNFVELVETACLESFTQLVMTLSDQVFRPYFLHFVDWASKTTSGLATVGSGGQEISRRVVTLAHLVHVLSSKLKRYFTPYFAHVLRLFTQYLENENECLSNLGEDAPVMVQFVCSSLTNCFLYDAEGFVTPDRFTNLINSIGAQFNVLKLSIKVDGNEDEDNVLGVEESDGEMYERMEDSVFPCVVALADSLGDEDQLKALNKVILRACTDYEARVRVCGVRALFALYERLGEEMNATLPDTVSILTELLEDPDETVEKAVHKLMQEIERHLTEPLANYLQ